jgi:hypothetical protein
MVIFLCLMISRKKLSVWQAKFNKQGEKAEHSTSAFASTRKSELHTL